MNTQIFPYLVSICLMVLVSCSPRFTPVNDPPLAPPQLKSTSFISFDGTELPLRTWLPADSMANARSILIAVHGFNDYSNFINKSSGLFSKNGTAVFAYDQRGFGNSPHRGRWSSSSAMAQDLQTLAKLIKHQYPDVPLYLLGHSMGGAVVIEAMADGDHPEIAGTILVAPAVWASSTMPFYQNTSLWLVAHTIPWFTVTGETLHRQACSDIEVLKALGRDPLVIKETRFDTIYGLQYLMNTAYAKARYFRLKTLLLYGLHDEIIPEEPVLTVFDLFPTTPEDGKKLILYNDGYHMLLRDLQSEKVMQDIIAWMNRA